MSIAAPLLQAVCGCAADMQAPLLQANLEADGAHRRRTCCMSASSCLSELMSDLFACCRLCESK